MSQSEVHIGKDCDSKRNLDLLQSKCVVGIIVWTKGSIGECFMTWFDCGQF